MEARTVTRRKAAAETSPAPPPVMRPPAPLVGARLPLFTGSEHFCTKCGGSGAKTLYLNSGQTCTHCHNEGFRAVWGMERLHRTCETCGFAWDEACVQPVRELKETLMMPVVPSVKRDRRYG